MGDTGALGALIRPEELIQSGVISDVAVLKIAAFSRRLVADSAPRKDRVKLNFAEIALDATTTEVFLSGQPEVWTVTSIPLPLKLVRFPSREKGKPVTPMDNYVEIFLDEGNQIRNVEGWCGNVDWVELSFTAMAPVLMVHGNGQGDDGAGGKFWEGGILDSAGKPREEMGYGIVEVFKQQRVPFDNSISMYTDTIVQHGKDLAKLIPEIAAEFGTRHVHLLAHSKGGLDSRRFLVETIPNNFGVLSLITLSTPHQGSSGPDYQIDAAAATLGYSDDQTRAFIGYMAPPNKGTPDLRVASTRRFNATNVPRLPKTLTVDGETAPVAYRSFSADMNLDDSYNFVTGNPTLSYDETFGLPGQGLKPNFLWTSILQTAYRITGYVIETNVETDIVVRNGVPIQYRVIREQLSKEFRNNDIAVTREAASVGPFVEIHHLKANHSTIARPDTAMKVIEELRRIQPMPPPGYIPE